MKVIFKKGGFTLVEMLVMIVIIGIISSILIVNWRRNENQYQLQRAAQEVAQNIRKAQEMALAGRNCPGTTPPLPASYGLHFYRDNPNSYAMFCDKNNNGTYQPSDEFVENISIESGVQIHSLSSGNQDLDVVFTLPEGFVKINPSAAAPAIITIKKTGTACPSSSCKTITIRKTGEVSID